MTSELSRWIWQTVSIFANLHRENVIFVSESGIRTSEDIQRLHDSKIEAVLVGETLMRSPDKKAALEELNGAPLTED